MTALATEVMAVGRKQMKIENPKGTNRAKEKMFIFFFLLFVYCVGRFFVNVCATIIFVYKYNCALY